MYQAGSRRASLSDDESDVECHWQRVSKHEEVADVVG